MQAHYRLGEECLESSSTERFGVASDSSLSMNQQCVLAVQMAVCCV